MVKFSNLSIYLIVIFSVSSMSCAKPKAEKVQTSSKSKKSTNIVENLGLDDDFQALANGLSNIDAEELVQKFEQYAGDFYNNMDNFIPQFLQQLSSNNIDFTQLANSLANSTDQATALLEQGQDLLNQLDDSGANSELKDRVLSALGNVDWSADTLQYLGSLLTAKTAN